jgi:hypothetical protein
MMSEGNTGDSDILYTRALDASRSTEVIDEFYRIAQVPQ